MNRCLLLLFYNICVYLFSVFLTGFWYTHSPICTFRLYYFALCIVCGSLLEIMAAAVGKVMGTQANSFLRGKNGEKNLVGRRNVTVMASVAFPGMKEEYQTLRLSPGAAGKDVKSAFRRLALQYHPDVCKGNDCGVEFQKINQAYETIMSSLAQAKQQNYPDDYYMDGLMGINNDPYDQWEEWMGWEGAGTLDYSSHINIYA